MLLDKIAFFKLKLKNKKILLSFILFFLLIGLVFGRGGFNKLKTNEGTQMRHIKIGQYINAVAWNKDDSLLAVLSDVGGHITVFDTSTWEMRNEFDLYTGLYAGNSLTFLPDDSLVLTTPTGTSPDPSYKDLTVFSLMNIDSKNGSLIKYYPNLPQKEGQQLTQQISIGHHTISKDGALIAGIMDGGGNDIFVFNAASGQLIKRFSIPRIVPKPGYGPELITALAFSPNGQELVLGTGTPDNSAKLIFCDPFSGKLLRKFIVFRSSSDDVDPLSVNQYSINNLAYSGDGRYIAIGKKVWAASELNTEIISIWDVDKGKQIGSLDGKEIFGFQPTQVYEGFSLSWSHDVLASGEGRSLKIWSTKDMNFKLIKEINDRDGAYSVSFSHSTVLAASLGNELLIVNFK